MNLRYAMSITVAVCLLGGGCDSSPPAVAPPASPTTRPQPAPPALTVIDPESKSWSREDCVAKLADESTALGAALRLFELASLKPTCVPATLSDRTLTRTRVVPLAPGWAVGVMDLHDDNRLRAPVLIAADGAVREPVTGLEQELATLHISKDPELFPHLIVTPSRVLMLDDPGHDAIRIAEPQTVMFRLAKHGEFFYLSLRFVGDGEHKELAKYVWDGFSLSFAGPGCDKLPDPPGGFFKMDLKLSNGLNPVGGTIPDAQPIPNKAPPRQRPGQPGDDGSDT